MFKGLRIVKQTTDHIELPLHQAQGRNQQKETETANLIDIFGDILQIWYIYWVIENIVEDKE